MRLIGGDLHDAVAQPNALRALAGGGEKYLGRGRMRVLLKEMVLDFPHIIIAQFVGEFDLSERILEQFVFAVRIPGPRQLMLIENAEFHGRSFCLACSSLAG